MRSLWTEIIGFSLRSTYIQLCSPSPFIIIIINQAYIKANRILGMIKRAISYKSRSILLQLYKSLVRPHLEYCTVSWSPYYQKDKKILEKIQRRFTRLIYIFVPCPTLIFSSSLLLPVAVDLSVHFDCFFCVY